MANEINSEQPSTEQTSGLLLSVEPLTENAPLNFAPVDVDDDGTDGEETEGDGTDGDGTDGTDGDAGGSADDTTEDSDGTD
jgi:hypothetical protein